MRDLYANIDAQVIYMENRATQASGTRTTDDVSASGWQTKGYNGRAFALVTAYLDANCAAADTITVTIQKCTDDNGTDAATLAAGAAIAGTGAAQFVTQKIALPLDDMGPTFDYLRASVAYVDANTSGSTNVTVAIIADHQRY